MRSTRAILTIVVVAFLGGVVLSGYRGAAQEAPAAEYVGSGKLHAMCHKQQHDVWSETLHAKQKPAADATPDAKYRRSTGYEQKGDEAEAGIRCEACHGPAKPHMDAPLTKKKGTSLVATTLKDPLAAMAICARCHSQGAMDDGTKYPKGYAHGKRLPEGYKLAATVAGTTRLRQFNDLQGSKHIENGVTCITCHTAHGGMAAKPQLRKPLNELCLDCHAAQADVVAHSKIATAKPDSKCNECHMPEKKHVFKTPPAQ
ncbi:MAG: cytochrome c3 family protein [Armatimonadota bacterium]